jgi:DNA modification methylase
MKVGNGTSYLGDTNAVMDDLIFEEVKVDYVLTSPPYNMRGHEKEMYNNAKTFRDNMTNEEYRDWIVGLFHRYDKLLNPCGVVIFNLNYMSSRQNKAINLFKVIDAIEENTNFTLIDQVCWKKDTAMALTEARLSRVWENIWIFIRKSDWDDFNQKFKKHLTGKRNFIEAPNNDGATDINKATFSSSMVVQMLTLYNAQQDSVVLDNFMGTHTTAIGCEKIGCEWIGIEIDEETRVHGVDRVNYFIGQFNKIIKKEGISLFDFLEETL